MLVVLLPVNYDFDLKIGTIDWQGYIDLYT